VCFMRPFVIPANECGAWFSNGLIGIDLADENAHTVAVRAMVLDVSPRFVW